MVVDRINIKSYLFDSQPLWGDKVSLFTHSYAHKHLRKIKVTIFNHLADSPPYVWPNAWSGDLQVYTWHHMSLLRPGVLTTTYFKLNQLIHASDHLWKNWPDFSSRVVSCLPDNDVYQVEPKIVYMYEWLSLSTYTLYSPTRFLSVGPIPGKEY